MNWYGAHYLCKRCKGCEAVADGDAECYVELENCYDEEEEF